MLQRGGLNLTAVTVTAENNHTVAFWAPLTAASKVYLTPNGTSTEYDSILVEINKRVKRDLVLSGDLASLYAMTQDKVFRLPVQECLSYPTCTQCRDSQDPTAAGVSSRDDAPGRPSVCGPRKPATGCGAGASLAWPSPAPSHRT